MSDPKYTICIPHWQVRPLMGMCLTALQQHTAGQEVEILVVDNGSRDGSLVYLRAFPGIRLIERPEESFHNWPANVFTAWDVGVREARGDYFVTMHTDVLWKQPGLLERLRREIESAPAIAAAGAWKLDLEPAWYTWQKDVLGTAVARVKSLFGRKNRSVWPGGRYPRDYCAMYRRNVIVENNLTFCPTGDEITGGYAIARQLWALGCGTRLIPTREMARYLVHIAHGTAALAAEKPLHHRGAQRKVERRVAALFAEPWVQALQQAGPSPT